MKDFILTVVLLFYGVFVMSAAIVATYAATKHKIEQEAAERGYAIYCSGAGDFAWKGECEPEEDAALP